MSLASHSIKKRQLARARYPLVHLQSARHGRGRHHHGITVDSGVLNPDLLKGRRVAASGRVRLRDRIDAIIAHEWAEISRALTRRP